MEAHNCKWHAVKANMPVALCPKTNQLVPLMVSLPAEKAAFVRIRRTCVSAKQYRNLSIDEASKQCFWTENHSATSCVQARSLLMFGVNPETHQLSAAYIWETSPVASRDRSQATAGSTLGLRARCHQLPKPAAKLLYYLTCSNYTMACINKQ